MNSQSQGRTRGLQNQQVDEAGLSLEDIGKILRGSADILDSNNHRIRDIVDQAAREG